MKSKFKFLITAFALFLMLFNSICFASDISSETMLISDTTNYQEPTTINSDLYITDSEYEINTTVNGNVFVLTDKFILKEGCQINGDLYICAKEVTLEQYSKIDGNVFVISNTINLNAEIKGSLYASVQNFEMPYVGFISRDLVLYTNNATINGYIDRNTVIQAENITINDSFVNQKDFTVIDADSLTFSGEIKGNATINAKNIIFKDKENDNNLICKIHGNLSYSSETQIEIPEGVVSKEINYNSYATTSSNNTLSNILDYILNLIGLLILAHVLYVLINKFAPKYLDKISNITVLSLLKYLGIGLAFLILLPIISILLFVSNIGTILGILLLLIYIILLIISKTIFIISIAKYVKNKCAKKLNIYLYILIIDVILSLITLIPYVGFIISMLISLIGFGMITRNLIPKKN